MSKSRLEAFSDGVLAIIITIMVLEMKVPHGGEIADLKPLFPVFLSYVLSFVYLAIYWNNHHHLLHTVKSVKSDILWTNIHLLFWLSLVPFVTGWMGENHFAKNTVGLYGFVLLMAAVSFFILQGRILKSHGKDSPLSQEVGNDFKGKASLALYILGIALSFINEWIACILYVVVAVMWFIPDRRFERALN